MALGPKPGPQEADFTFRSKYSDFDYFDKNALWVHGFDWWNFNLMWTNMVYTKANSQGKRFWKSEIFSHQNWPKFDQEVGAKKTMCLPLPTTLDGLGIKYKVRNYRFYQIWSEVFWYMAKIARFGFWTLKTVNWQKGSKWVNFFPLSECVGIKNDRIY